MSKAGRGKGGDRARLHPPVQAERSAWRDWAERNVVFVTALGVLLMIAIVASVWAYVESRGRGAMPEGVLKPPTTTRPAPTNARPTATAEASGGGDQAKPGMKQWKSEPPMTIDPAKQYFAVIKTAKGDIRIQLFAAKVPHTVNNFVFLARQHYYDDTTFHRVISGFMAQGGDPTGTGTGGPGYQSADEFHPSLRHDSEGILSMANSGANTNGSQFFITYVPQPHLDGKHAVFGKVVSGMEVLRQITPRDPSKNPPPGDKILTITIEEK